MKQNPNFVVTQQPPLSELILEAATTHLSEEVLYRTPKESYEKLLWEEEQAELRKNVVATVPMNGSTNNGENDKKSLIQEWQTSRKEDEKKEAEEKKMTATE